MTTDARFPVVLLWHMHQPEYRVQGRFHLPWVALHAIKDYTDMAAHFEAVPEARAVVNFSPVLLDQIDDYVRRLNAHEREAQPIGDPLLDFLAAPPPRGAQRASAVAWCLRVPPGRRAEWFPAYAELLEEVREIEEGGPIAMANVSDALLDDLLLWSFLIWIGESVRNSDPQVQAWHARGRGFTATDRRQMLALLRRLIGDVLPRYRRLAASGRVELSMTPYYHPLMPLMLDFASARDSAPGTALPQSAYPEGAARVRWHLQRGRERFIELFGRPPAGCWPSEAALSDETLAALAETGFQWTASSQSVLNATMHHAGQDEDVSPHRPYAYDDTALRVFFRDDGFSDRIGFVYSQWQAADAVGELLAQLEGIALSGKQRMALIALDGENPWSYFPHNGMEFVRGLYAGLAAHAHLRPATMSDCLELPADTLPPLRAGSWVHGQLLTWVGHPEKNHAWELLIAAKQQYDQHPRDEALAHVLGACEGSDWFWWPGAYNPGNAVADFDALMRAHLSALYAALGAPPPAVLAQAFASGGLGTAAAGGTMQATEPKR